MSRLEKGDWITCVAFLGAALKACQVVSQRDGDIFCGKIYAIKVSDEGATWVRGKHDVDSETGKALLVAYGLKIWNAQEGEVR